MPHGERILTICSMVTIAISLSRTIFDISDFEKYRDLKIRIRGHWGHSKNMSHFSWPNLTSLPSVTNSHTCHPYHKYVTSHNTPPQQRVCILLTLHRNYQASQKLFIYTQIDGCINASIHHHKHFKHYNEQFS